MDNPFAQQQKILLYVFPLIFAVSGVNFPIGVLLYWLTTNVWSMGQQFYVIRRNPAPGSPAFEALEKRKAAKAARHQARARRGRRRARRSPRPRTTSADGAPATAAEPDARRQRQQPRRGTEQAARAASPAHRTGSRRRPRRAHPATTSRPPRPTGDDPIELPRPRPTAADAADDRRTWRQHQSETGPTRR